MTQSLVYENDLADETEPKHKLFVLMKDGRPLELEAADTETVSRLMDHDDGVCATFAIASTNRRYVEAMRQVLPDLLDSDRGPEQYRIAEFTA